MEEPVYNLIHVPVLLDSKVLLVEALIVLTVYKELVLEQQLLKLQLSVMRSKVWHSNSATSTCKNAQWECTKKRCDSTCSATGDPHYMTFDGFRYNFMGTCSYYMIKSDNFDVIADNIKCGHGFASCTKSITINIGGHRITLSHNHQLFFDNQEITKLPYQDDQIKITMVSSLFMKAVLSNGIGVLWDGRTRAYITAPPTFINKTEGLCGTFDYNQKNDFKTLQGIVETDVNAFGNQWKTVQTCANMPVGQVTNPCDSNAQQHEQAKKYCSYLKSDVFKLQEFYEDCEYDMCACTENIKDCLCPMLGEYAKQCAAKAVSIPWRTRVKECRK
ncbi:hypothetical protein KUTeg_008351 [Tegillarca granosa]|uniref:VWFD domain-containing protein n=1 Tax=Tegillarca granosa TaxID=220873 RepID=A0ABQ9F8X8_TEGGR|nr:hypothetical protein KUTeg_008351 [Tegillarca granosa]